MVDRLIRAKGKVGGVGPERLRLGGVGKRRAHAAEYLALTLAVGVAGAAAGWYGAGWLASAQSP